MIQFLQDKCLIVGVEDLEIRLGIIDFVLCLDGIQQSFKFNKGATLLLDENDLADLAKVAKDVIDAIVIETVR